MYASSKDVQRYVRHSSHDMQTFLELYIQTRFTMKQPVKIIV